MANPDWTLQDPTRDELVAALARMPFADEFDEFDREEAIYWFAANYHGGQASNLYRALCNSPYSPGPLTYGPDESSQLLYDDLVNHLNRSKRNRNAEAYAPEMLAMLRRICNEVETPKALLTAIAAAEALLRKIEG